MVNPKGKPTYDEGDIIFVDPDVHAEHGMNVVVRLDDQNEATFKKLIIEGERRYLKALNPAWPPENPGQILPINGNATLCGVVMGKWVPEW
jgi:SOS-response transcriptional repressor LexA